MTDIHWKYTIDNLCVICRSSLDTRSSFICNKCHQVCDIVHSEISNQLMDVKSVCCNYDIELNQKITCGKKNCHEKFVIKMIQEHGLFKKVIDQTTNIAYKVPTRTIIEEGLKQEDLENYPVWV